MNRRGFVGGLVRGLLSSAFALRGLPSAAAAPESTPSSFAAGLSADEWSALSLVFEHLLPSERDRPGAREVNATDYLRLALLDPKSDPDVPGFVHAGIVELETLCMVHYQQRFEALGADDRESVLRRLEDSPTGRSWLLEMLEYLLEAVLGDPIYGGNPGGIGWTWLGVDPGYPRPER